jgi:hypothetical protein
MTSPKQSTDVNVLANIPDESRDDSNVGKEEDVGTKPENTNNNSQGDDDDGKGKSESSGKDDGEGTPKRKNHDQRRWENHIRRTAAAEERARLLEQQNEALRYQLSGDNKYRKSNVANLDGEPSRDDYDSDIDYIEARATWIADKRVSSILREDEEKKRTESVREKYQRSMKDASEEYDDFDEVIDDSHIQLTPAVERAIVESEISGHLSYYLAKHEDEIRRLNSLSPQQVLREMGKLEARIEGEKSAKANSKELPVSKAAPPHKPVSSKGTANIDEDKLSDKEWITRRQAYLAKKQTH